MANLIYTPKDILQKEFKTKMRGYDPVEVDEFLDNVIKDYENYNKELLALKEENDRLQAKIDQLSKSQQVAARVQTEAPKSAAVTNFDILKRLSNLEREVFGKKLSDDEEAAPAPTPTPTSTRSSQNYSSYDDNQETRQF